MFEKLYSRELMLDRDGCAILAFQTECRLVLSVKTSNRILLFQSECRLVPVYVSVLFVEMVVHAVFSSCFLAQPVAVCHTDLAHVSFTGWSQMLLCVGLSCD